MRTTPTPFHVCLRKIRLERGYSQTDFSDITGFTQSQISDFETGRRTPSLVNLRRLRSALRCSWVDLLGAEPTK